MNQSLFDGFLIKYAEIGVKGKNRYLFEDALVNQIGHALDSVDGEFTVKKESGRIYVEAEKKEYDYDLAVDALKKVFGIVGICPFIQIEDKGYEDLSKQVQSYIDHMYPDKNFTFKVNARRSRKNYPLDSQELNRELGSDLLDAFPQLKVDVHNPDVMIHVEIRPMINIYSLVIEGPGGMPIGTAGKAMLLLSGGIDSPVAGYMVAKRGVKLEATYFHAPPYTSERAKQKVLDLAKLVSCYAGPIQVNVVNFTDIQLYIYEQCPHFAREDKCLGLITGESIGQVASQTMHSLAATNAVCTMPVYRPVIAMDKQEIVDIAVKIDTYDTSILPYEDCCTIFVAKHPVTKPNLNVIARSERKLEEKINQLVQTAIETTEKIVVGQ